MPASPEHGAPRGATRSKIDMDRRPLFWPVPVLLAAIHITLHIVTAGNYGVFRDEFYYWDCANHLAWGYVDHPPLSIALLAGWKAIFGDSVLSLRVLPALAGGVLVILVAYTTALVGGGRFAQSLAAVGTAIVPTWMGLTGIYSMNAFDLLFWALGYVIVIRIVNEGRARDWVWLGVVIGLGLMNKISISVFAVGLVMGIILTSQRRWLRTREPYLAAAIAALIFFPHIIWQIVNEWPTREFIQNAQAHKIADFSALDFLAEQVRQMHPFNLILWLPGLLFLLAGPPMGRYRLVGWVYLAALGVLLFQKSKPYYLAAAYPVLFAAGAIVLDRATRIRWGAWVRAVVVTLLTVGGVATTPFAVPVLPVEVYVRYAKTLGAAPRTDEDHALGELPQYYADRFGWESLADDVADVYRVLPEAARARCLIVAGNYGEAGAINYYGRRLGLPRAVSQHNSYYLWGPGTEHPSVVIAVGYRGQELLGVFDDVTPANIHNAAYAMPYESNLTLYICRGFKLSLEEAWAAGRKFI